MSIAAMLYPKEISREVYLDFAGKPFEPSQAEVRYADGSKKYSTILDDKAYPGYQSERLQAAGAKKVPYGLHTLKATGALPFVLIVEGAKAAKFVYEATGYPTLAFPSNSLVGTALDNELKAAINGRPIALVFDTRSPHKTKGLHYPHREHWLREAFFYASSVKAVYLPEELGENKGLDDALAAGIDFAELLANASWEATTRPPAPIERKAYDGRAKINEDLVAVTLRVLSGFEYQGRDREYKGCPKYWGPNQNQAKPGNLPKRAIRFDSAGVPFFAYGWAGEECLSGLRAIAEAYGINTASFYPERERSCYRVPAELEEPADLYSVQEEGFPEEPADLYSVQEEGFPEEPADLWEKEECWDEHAKLYPDYKEELREEPADLWGGYLPEEPAEFIELDRATEAIDREARAQNLLEESTQGNQSSFACCKAQVAGQIRARFEQVVEYFFLIPTDLFTCPELPGVVLKEVRPGLWANVNVAYRDFYTVYGGRKSTALCEKVLGFTRKALEHEYLAAHTPTFEIKHFVPNNDTLTNYISLKYPGMEIKRNNNQFITAEDIKKSKKIVFGIARTGGGKTTSAIQYVLDLGDKGAFLYVAHLRKLIQSFCEAALKAYLDVANYEDLKSDKRLKSQYLAICINSILSIIKKEESLEGDVIAVAKSFDLVLFDEIVSILDVLVAGETLLAIEALRVKTAMKTVMTAAGKVIFADATLSIKHIDLLMQMFGIDPNEVTVLINEYVPPQKTDLYLCAGGQNQLAIDAIKYGKENECGGFVLSTSKSALRRYYEVFKQAGLPCLPPIDSDSQEVDPQAYIENGLLTKKWVFASPAVSTGVDINVPGVVSFIDATLGYASVVSKPQMPTTAAQIQQMAGRNRKQAAVRLYTNNKPKACFVKSAKEYEQEILENNERLLAARYEAADLQSAPYSSMITQVLIPLYALNLRNNHWLLNDHLKHLGEHFNALGNYNIIYDYVEITSETIEETKEMECQISAVKEQIKNIRYDAILKVSDAMVDDEEWKFLKKGGNLTEDERNGRRAWLECKTFGLERAADLITDEEGNPKVATAYLTRDLHDLYEKGMGAAVALAAYLRRFTAKELATYVLNWGEGLEDDQDGNPVKVVIKESGQMGNEDRAFVMAQAGLPLLALLFGDSVLNGDGTLNWCGLPSWYDAKVDLAPKDAEVAAYLETKQGELLRAKFGVVFKQHIGEDTPRALLKAARGSGAKTSIFNALVAAGASEGLTVESSKADLVARAQVALEAHRKSNPCKVKEVTGLAHRVAKLLLRKLGIKVAPLGVGVYELELLKEIEQWSDAWATVDKDYQAILYAKEDAASENTENENTVLSLAASEYAKSGYVDL